jgi:hypothetical protein
MATISKLLAETASSDSTLSLYKSHSGKTGEWLAIVGNPKSRRQFHFEAVGFGGTAALAVDHVAKAIVAMRRSGSKRVEVDHDGLVRGAG